jgi:Domain of unknown function (DUF3291)
MGRPAVISTSPTNVEPSSAHAQPVWHIAQVNVARMREPLDASAMREFVDGLVPINELADASDGFVWRLQTEQGDATSLRVFDDEMMLVNLSVWDSIEALEAFVYRSDHASYLRRRSEWFHRLGDAITALWWLPAGSRPAVDEALRRLELLRERGGPSPEAFTFRERFAPPHRVSSAGGS